VQEQEAAADPSHEAELDGAIQHRHEAQRHRGRRRQHHTNRDVLQHRPAPSHHPGDQAEQWASDRRR
jgi:hypothetical protein